MHLPQLCTLTSRPWRDVHRSQAKVVMLASVEASPDRMLPRCFVSAAATWWSIHLRLEMSKNAKHRGLFVLFSVSVCLFVFCSACQSLLLDAA